MRTVTKKQLTEIVADSTKVSQSIVRDVVQQFLETIVDELAKGNRLEFRDFGVFEVRTRKSRMAQNPRTLERVVVPVRAIVKFKAGRVMKERVQRLSAAAPSGRKAAAAASESASPPAP